MRCQPSKRSAKRFSYLKIGGKKLSFQQSWKKIVQLKEKEQDDMSYKYDLFSSLILCRPKEQSYLTSPGNIIYKDIEWHKYIENPSYKINVNELFDCFQGILQYIYFSSENKFNIDQVEFFYSKANERCNYDPKSKYIKDRCDILNIFDYKNISTYFFVPSVLNGYFGVTFKKVKIVPLCYSIRSENSCFGLPHLDSFVFEGYDEETHSWDVLDERININELIPSGGYGLFYVKTVKKSYSSFIIRQTAAGHNGMWGFSIAAFEIHGIPSETVSVISSEIAELNEYTNDNFIDTEFDLNPCIEMSSFL